MQRLSCAGQRALAARLLRQLRTIGKYHVHPVNPYARYWVAYHNCRGGVGQPPCKPNTARYYVADYCGYLCTQADFM